MVNSSDFSISGSAGKSSSGSPINLKVLLPDVTFIQLLSCVSSDISPSTSLAISKSLRAGMQRLPFLTIHPKMKVIVQIMKIAVIMKMRRGSEIRRARIAQNQFVKTILGLI